MNSKQNTPIVELKAVGFNPAGELLSLDSGGRALRWSLPAGAASPTELAAKEASELSPTYRRFTVAIDPLDPRLLRLEREVVGQLPYSPWEEDAARQAAQ